jgi:hypothetical protein
MKPVTLPAPLPHITASEAAQEMARPAWVVRRFCSMPASLSTSLVAEQKA